MKNEVTVKIFNREFHLMTDETKEYTDRIAKDLNEKMMQLLRDKTTLSAQDAAALVALECYDEMVKAKEEADQIRIQIKDYADDSSNTRLKAEESQKEIERLKEKIAQMEKELKLRKELYPEHEKADTADEIITRDINKVMNDSRSNVPYNTFSNNNRNFR